jgi:hypothetical protein
VLREREGVAARIVEEFGVDADQVRSRIGPPGPRWSSYGPMRGRFRRPRTKWKALSEARDAALEEGDYDLARKLLELEIEARQKGSEPPE